MFEDYGLTMLLDCWFIQTSHSVRLRSQLGFTIRATLLTFSDSALGFLRATSAHAPANSLRNASERDNGLNPYKDATLLQDTAWPMFLNEVARVR